MQYTYMTFIDTLINYFFDTLTDQAASNKLSYFVYKTTLHTFQLAQRLATNNTDDLTESQMEQKKIIKLKELRNKMF